MKTIGLIGGMSWESTQTYYQLLNEGVKNRLGGLHSAKILLYSVDFFEVEALMSRGAWDEAAALLSKAARNLEAAGADFILIGTNTLHKVAPQVQAQIRVPLIHIAQAAARRLNERGIARVALLGTRYTMTQAFYREKLVERGIDVLIPEEADIDLVDRVIFSELCLGLIRQESRAAFLRVIARLQQRGAEGVLLGCTELGMIVSQPDVPLPLFDSLSIHAELAVALALEEA